MKELSIQRHNLKLKLAKLCLGRPLAKFTYWQLQACYEQYQATEQSHAILIEQGIQTKDIEKFTSLPRKNDDNAIPNIMIDGGEIGYPGVYIHKLNIMTDKGAAIAACLGRMTNCCQHLGGAGEACTIHGISSVNGGFYVLRVGDPLDPKPENIKAHAWVWKSENNNLCFDSVETSSNNHEMISDMFRSLAYKLCQLRENRLEFVNTGSGSGISKHIGLKAYPVAPEKPVDYMGYRDSHKQMRTADSSMPYLLLGQVH